MSDNVGNHQLIPADVLLRGSVAEENLTSPLPPNKATRAPALLLIVTAFNTHTLTSPYCFGKRTAIWWAYVRCAFFPPLK